ncbi:MAG: endonuclease/exonuclease/phosphatase family protein [Bryobacter sp.]|nr:endonuclease/exonuclease/phosphatase family protein [Bryobacter sp.]
MLSTFLRNRKIAAALALFLMPGLWANNTSQTVPYSLVSADPAWVTTDDDWSGASGILGFRGDGLSSSTSTDPQNTLADDVNAVLDVNANRTDPSSFSTGGIAEFTTAVGSAEENESRTLYAMQGSGTADAPYLQFHFTTTGASNLTFSYTAVDLDAAAVSSVQRIAVHYRTATTGTWTNLPDGFIADASEGPSLAGLRTTRTFSLPAAAANQATLQIRIMTNDAPGVDEFIGIENVSLTGTSGGPIPPSGTGSADPASVQIGNSTLLSVNVVPGTNSVTSVVADLTSIGGSAAQAFTNTTGNTWTFNATANGTAGLKSLPVTITDNAALTGTTSIALNVTAPVLLTSINAIQGSGNTSPLVGQTVSTSGVVTFIRLNRFYIQNPDAAADANPQTSEGLLVQSTSSLPSTVAVGNLVSVTGTVDEYRPDTNHLTITRILNPTSITALSTGNPLPTPVTLDGTSFTANGGLFQAEQFEAMRTQVPSLTITQPSGSEFVVAASSNGTSSQNLNGIVYGTFGSTSGSTLRPFREPGIGASTSPVPNCDQPPCTIASYDLNPENLRVDTFRLGNTFAATTGATVVNLLGVLTYENRYYTLLAENNTNTTVSGNRVATPVPTPTAGEITVATWNVENFTGTVTEIAKASLGIRNFLKYPDVLVTIEMNQPAALSALAAQINADALAAAEPAPNYQTRIITPPNAGQQNIGLLAKGDVTILSANQFLAARTFIDPNDGSVDTTFDRPPLVVELQATRAGKTIQFTVIGNHLLSLIDIDNEAPSGAGTIAARRRAKRKDQAEAMAELLQQRLTANPNEKIFLVGDFNAFQFNDGYVDVVNGIRGVPAAPGQAVATVNDLLSATTLNNLVDFLPAAERYSFAFQGSAQVLDHILYTPNLQAQLSRGAYARVSADFPSAFGSDASRVERLSDHDAALFYLLAAEPVSSGIVFTRFGGIYNPTTQRTLTNLRITNNTGTTLEAPWQLVIPDPAANITLANATGSNAQGKYITVNTPLAPGANTTIPLQFATPGRVTFVYNPKVYSGAF